MSRNPKTPDPEPTPEPTPVGDFRFTDEEKAEAAAAAPMIRTVLNTLVALQMRDPISYVDMAEIVYDPYRDDKGTTQLPAEENAHILACLASAAILTLAEIVPKHNILRQKHQDLEKAINAAG